MSNKDTKAPAAKTEVKAPAAPASEAKTVVDTKAPAEKAEKKVKEPKAPKAAPEPRTEEVPTYVLFEDIKDEEHKGQRLGVIKAFRKNGNKAISAENLVNFCDNTISKQNIVAVLRYHVLKMLEDGLVKEVGKETVEVPKRTRKAKAEAAAPASAAPTPAA